MNKVFNMSKEHKKASLELFFRIGNISKIISDECYNKNGKNNKDSLTMPQFTALEIIKRNGGKLNLKDIAKKKCNSKGAISIMISKLEALNYIEKSFDPDKDKRSIGIKLTQQGEKVLENKEEETMQLVSERINKCLSEDDIEFLINTHPRYMEILKKLEVGGCNE